MISVSGNITGGNVNTSGLVNATGNVTGNIVTATGAFMVMPVAASDPASPVTGAFYYNSALAVIRIWTGSSWISR